MFPLSLKTQQAGYQVALVAPGNFGHDTIDGTPAARFMRRLQKLIEVGCDPVSG